MRIAPFVFCGLGLVPMPAPAEHPGVERGATLLPNGWRIKPAGRHITVGDLPLALAESPDGRFVVVSNNGYEKPTLTVVDLERLVVRQTQGLDNAWLGLAFDPRGERLFSSGGNANALDVLPWSNARLGAPSKIPLGEKLPSSFLGGLAVAPDGKRLFVVDPLGQTLLAVDLQSSRLEKTMPLPAEPYTCLLSQDGGTLYVSLWGGAKVMALDAATLEIRKVIRTGEHPNAMALSRDGARLFVACANTNAVWALDLEPGRAAEQISVALYPKAPEGATPNALGLSPDGRTLLVANADNNAVAVVDVARPGSSRVEGFIPAGWYPTAARFTRDGKRILILSGKGLTSQANPRGPQPGITGAPSQYVGALLRGALSILPAPSARQLAAYTKTVYALTPYRDANLLAPAKAPAGSPIPQRVGGRSPIRHVFYIIRENRTYDQILGDVARGNGDPNLCLFGEDVTPNAHALASEFVLLDNFYVNAEVSHTGHSFSTGAYATDVTEKVWPINYAGRGGKYVSEGGGPDRNAYGNVSAPAAGYIWDACRRAGVSVRSYGEFAVAHTETDFDTAGRPPYVGSVPGLKGFVCPDYPPYDLSIPDGRRVDVWLEEFRRFEKEGTLPRLSIIRLGNDHTVGTKVGGLTPRSMIAENDQALGRIVEAISQSRVWKESAVFILEDDAQNGPDHVDAHRSVALVASPFARRGAVDSTLYTTCGVLRTIELLLGLPPMSQYDAAATPMYRAFQSAADLRPFARREALVPTDEKNAPEAFGAQASALMDFSQPDRAPEQALNEILWKSVKGAASPMPPPVRAAFVRPVKPTEEEDDD
ncbi:MAG TPA: alkaline phosphatase family protein [Thermoanaerobaculia bacterium]|nr:alkaline phosphatase family protein [Thermoanaerobaculia bacterium]